MGMRQVERVLTTDPSTLSLNLSPQNSRDEAAYCTRQSHREEPSCCETDIRSPWHLTASDNTPTGDSWDSIPELESNNFGIFRL